LLLSPTIRSCVPLPPCAVPPMVRVKTLPRSLVLPTLRLVISKNPKPDVYLRALEQVGADVALSYAVEDSVSGVKAAVAAGLKTFGYTGFGNDPIKDQDKLIKAGAHACFSDWRDFLSMI
jgi:beta-phosphoglucomutase-like phosphatase (HAD superfamily)